MHERVFNARFNDDVMCLKFEYSNINNFFSRSSTNRKECMYKTDTHTHARERTHSQILKNFEYREINFSIFYLVGVVNHTQRTCFLMPRRALRTDRRSFFHQQFTYRSVPNPIPCSNLELANSNLGYPRQL